MWAFIGGLVAVFLEISFRKGILSWSTWQTLPAIVVLGLLIDFTVWKNVTSAQVFIQAIVLFGLVTATGRIAASFFLFHDPVTWQNAVSAAALMIAAGLRLV